MAATVRHRAAEGRAGRTQYLVLSTVVLVLVAGQQVNAQWSGDAWLHTAAVREFADHLLAPREPVLGVDAPHPMLSPYSLALGTLARCLGSPIRAMSLAGVLNVVVLLGAWRSYVRALLPTSDDRAAFWALLLLLTMWLPGAWRWSGFPHLGSLGFVAPFPSMFALSLTLVVVASVARAVRGTSRWGVLPFAIGLPVILLTHPPTAVAVVAGVVGVSWAHRREISHDRKATLLFALVGGLGLAACWPWFPVFALRPTEAFAAAHREFYEEIWFVLPSLLGVPVLLARWRRSRADALGLIFLISTLLIAVGLITGATGLARLVPFALMQLQVGLGGWARDFEARLSQRWRRPTIAAALVVLVVWGVILGRAALVRAVPTSWLPEAISGEARLISVPDRYGFLEGALLDDDLLLVGPRHWRAAPAFAPVAAAFYNNPYLTDNGDRRAEVSTFFSAATPDEWRDQLVRRRRITHVLIDEADLPVRRWLEARRAEAMATKGGLTLYRLEPATAGIR